MNSCLLEILKDIYVTSVLIVATYWDLKKREVEPVYWLYASIGGLILSGLSIYLGIVPWSWSFYILFSIVAVLVVGALFLIGYMGGADLYAIIFISLSTPLGFEFVGKGIIPIPLLTVLYSALASLSVPIYFCMKNLLFNRNILKTSRRKIILCFLGIPITVEEYVRSKGYWFPLTGYGNNEVRYLFDIEEEPDDHKKRFRKQMSQGKIRPDTVVWITPGLPFILFILIGFVLSIIISDAPFMFLGGGN